MVECSLTIILTMHFYQPSPSAIAISAIWPPPPERPATNHDFSFFHSPGLVSLRCAFSFAAVDLLAH